MTIHNSLYLCGTNDAPSDSVGSYLLKIDLSVSPIQPLVLINSIFSHYYPSLIQFKNELIVIGGKNQIQCECYQLANSKWKQMPSLPEERFKATAFSNEKGDSIYLFGGNTLNGNSKSILKLNMFQNSVWEIININQNENFLARNSSVAFMFESTDNIYICGGKDNNNNDTEFIVEYNIKKNSLKKFDRTLKKVCSFDMQGFVDLNQLHFAFFDSNNYVHTISRNGFRMSIIKFDDFCQIRNY